MYLYEMHSHTREVSKCANASARETMLVYKKLGYSGVCITDHFFNSYNNIDSNMPWSDQVDAFMLGYCLAKEEGKKLGLDVFFGWEYRYYYNYDGQTFQDFLTYGLGKEWLLNNPDCTKWGFLKYCDEVHKAGGTIIYAHPFRQIKNINEPAFTKLEYIDGIEVCNTSDSDDERTASLTYAIKHNMPISCGGDNHDAKTTGLYAFDIGYKQASLSDLIGNILKGSGKIVKI